MRTRFAAFIPVLALTAVGAAQTAFTYQGRVKDGTQVASGPYDLRFSLFDSSSGGTQIGSTQCVNDVAVTDGVFTTTVDFGQQFNTPVNRFLEIEARADTGLSCSNSSGFVVLGPRQLLTATPRAIHARSAFSLASPDGLPAQALTVSNDGHIGIGTTNPVQPLQVANELPVMILQDTGNSSSQSGYLGFWTAAGTETGWVGFGTPANPHFSIFNGRGSGDIVLLPASGRVRMGVSGEFLGTAGHENLRILRGTVNSGGTRIAGTGFTSSRPGVGDYTITFDAAFSARPTITATCEWVSGSTGRVAHTDIIANTGLNIVVVNNSGTLADSEFSFIAIGPRN